MWNVRYVLTGEQLAYDNTHDEMYLLGKMSEIPEIQQNIQQNTEPTHQEQQFTEEDVAAVWEYESEIYAVIIPRGQWSDPEVMRAMREELEKFKLYDAYEIVDVSALPRGVNIVNTSWVNTKKFDSNGRAIYKAR